MAKGETPGDVGIDAFDVKKTRATAEHVETHFVRDGTAVAVLLPARTLRKWAKRQIEDREWPGLVKRNLHHIVPLVNRHLADQRAGKSTDGAGTVRLDDHDFDNGVMPVGSILDLKKDIENSGFGK